MMDGKELEMRRGKRGFSRIYIERVLRMGGDGCYCWVVAF